jgi:thiamine biosynthesis lipoprotein
VRRWIRGGRSIHHIIDPRTGAPATEVWRTASVHSQSALAANTASTAAIVLGEDALPWLTKRNLAARLVANDGHVQVTAGWPVQPLAAVA